MINFKNQILENVSVIIISHITQPLGVWVNPHPNLPLSRRGVIKKYVLKHLLWAMMAEKLGRLIYIGR